MQRLAREDRILRPNDFAQVRKRGKSARQNGFAVAILPGIKRRLGIAVSKRCGGAVQRNRIKRVVREFFRLNRDKFPVGDCVVIPAAGAGKMDNEDIRAALESVLLRLKKRP